MGYPDFTYRCGADVPGSGTILLQRQFIPHFAEISRGFLQVSSPVGYLDQKSKRGEKILRILFSYQDDIGKTPISYCFFFLKYFYQFFKKNPYNMF